MKCKKCSNEMIRYIVKILTVEDFDKSMLKAISHICGCNFLEAKKILEETGKEFNPMDAIETRKLKNRLEEYKILYDISPDYNW